MDTMDRSTFRYYQHNADELARRYETADVSDLHRRLLETFPSGSKLLEIGCGSGREAAFILSQGFEVDGIDPSKAMIERALSFHPELEGRLFTGTLPHDIPSHLEVDGLYSGIYSVATLMHLSENQLPDAFRQIHRLLAGGGNFLFSVPLSRPDLEESGYDSKGRYFLILTEREWIDKVKKAGFRNVRVATNNDGMGRDSVEWLSCVAEK